METSKSYKLQMHKHNDCMRTHTRTLTPTNPNAHSFTTTQTQDQLNILRRIWTTEHAFGKISLSESRKASPVKELSQNKKRKLGGGGYSRCHMVRGGMNLTSMCLDCGRMLEDVERIVADTSYTQKKLYHIKY